ncbi:MAG TPA: adenylate/guanylate cyclase domain-containing protein [Candidatus Binatia bacterium]
MPPAAIPGARFEAPPQRPHRVRALREVPPRRTTESPRARLAAGTLGQKALFVLLLAVFLFGLWITVADKLRRVGEPDVGFLIDGGVVSPTRPDASDAGLRGGGIALAVNGVALSDLDRLTERIPAVRRELGASNTITFERIDGTVREVTVPVQLWDWHDALFTEGGSGLIGLLFFVVGTLVFALRPYEITSWALYALATIVGAALITIFVPITDDRDLLASVYFRFIIGVTAFVPYHLALAFPVPHRLLLRGRGALWLIYGGGVAQGLYNLVAWRLGFVGPFAYTRTTAAVAMVAAIVLFVVRCAEHAVRSRDALVKQRARILLAGIVFGLGPLVVLQLAQQAIGVTGFDMRFAFWALGILVVALARITLRPELMNARIAVRRALIYATVVGVLTLLAVALVSVRPYAVALLLLPLLYVWPHFDAWLDDWLYPQRAHFPELLREIGNEMATCGTVDDVLDVLTRAPERLCDARSSVAFLLAGTTGGEERVRSSDGAPVSGTMPLGDETVVLLLRTTRKEILRDRIAVDPQFSNVKDECYAGFDRLRAELLIPILEDSRVIGGLAVGARSTGDVYQAAEIDALSTVAQQASQALLRVRATDRLRARELEFADLKRFFPPQIIDQVMARGGAAELRSQRKLVTVVFADLRGFTSFSESVEPEEVMATLAEYHAATGRRIAEFGGTLERFAGDGFMVFFNDPLEQPDHARRAAEMALAMRDDVRRLREGWARKGYAIDVGMGIDSGYATCGFIGYEGRRDYGVIGKVSNLAARLSAAAAPGEILITARVAAELRDTVRTELVGELTLKGFAQPQLTYRLLDRVS